MSVFAKGSDGVTGYGKVHHLRKIRDRGVRAVPRRKAFDGPINVRAHLVRKGRRHGDAKHSMRGIKIAYIIHNTNGTN